MQFMWSTIAFLLLVAGAAVQGVPQGKPLAAGEESRSITVEIDSSVLPDHSANKKVVLSREALAKLPRQAVQTGPNEAKYEGVGLATILEHAGMKWEKRCVPPLAAYVIVEAADGYRALFALAEIHPAYREHMIILADTVDGRPLKGNEAPWKIVEQRKGFGGRGVRLVTNVSIRMPPPVK